MIIAGGLSPDHTQWVPPRKTFLPVHASGSVFRGKFTRPAGSSCSRNSASGRGWPIQSGRLAALNIPRASLLLRASSRDLEVRAQSLINDQVISLARPGSENEQRLMALHGADFLRLLRARFVRIFHFAFLSTRDRLAFR